MHSTKAKEMATKAKTTTPTTQMQKLFQATLSNVHFVTNQDIKLTNVSQNFQHKKINQVKDQTIMDKINLVKENIAPSVRKKGTLNKNATH